MIRTKRDRIEYTKGINDVVLNFLDQPKAILDLLYQSIFKRKKYKQEVRTNSELNIYIIKQSKFAKQVIK